MVVVLELEVEDDVVDVELVVLDVVLEDDEVELDELDVELEDVLDVVLEVVEVVELELDVVELEEVEDEVVVNENADLLNCPKRNSAILFYTLTRIQLLLLLILQRLLRSGRLDQILRYCLLLVLQILPLTIPLSHPRQLMSG